MLHSKNHSNDFALVDQFLSHTNTHSLSVSLSLHPLPPSLFLSPPLAALNLRATRIRLLPIIFCLMPIT